MTYTVFKHIHLLSIALSGLLFFGRGVMDLLDYPWRRWTVLRWLPHLVDTILLISAISLCFMIMQYPLANHWLTAKVVALFAYIAFGFLALKSSICRSRRFLFFVLALFSFVYIVGVARMHHPASWLAFLWV